MNNGNVVGLETRVYIEGVTWLGKVDTGISLYVFQWKNKGNKRRESKRVIRLAPL